MMPAFLVLFMRTLYAVLTEHDMLERCSVS